MSSPWGKIEKVETSKFEDIMSEDYARELQNKENKKYGEQIREEIVKTCKEEHPEKSVDIIPEDVLKIIREDSSMAETSYSEFDSDSLIAQVLQAQFDTEYNEELKRIEKQKNKDSKISVSYRKYERHGDNDLQEEEDYYDDDYDNPKRDWDRFETNEKKFDAIPKCGFKIDKEGEMITKHDEQICGVRNACRVMSFPPDFPTGDGACFEMKLSNPVFNQLKTYSRKPKKNNFQDRKENNATVALSLDERTRRILYKLISSNQILEQVNGVISSGKEALIVHADSDPSYIGELALPKECAIKIFKTTLNEFKQRDRYIKDDYRFKDRFSKQNNRVVINMWAEKEMHNMMRMRNMGINCPDVIILKKHILVMSFIGDNHNPAPKLKDARLSEEELSAAYDEVVLMMHKMYNEANLVHADLSEYNILWYDGKCWFIDVAQSVEPSHPSALEFLMRDCTNIVNFFSRRGLTNISTKEELFEYITSLNAQSYNTAMLERIHTRGASIKEATAPNQEEMPEELKLISYPFDLAWQKTMEDKSKANTENALNVEATDALKVFSIQQPVDCKTE